MSQDQIRPYFTTRKLVPENQEAPIQSEDYVYYPNPDTKKDKRLSHPLIHNY